MTLSTVLFFCSVYFIQHFLKISVSPYFKRKHDLENANTITTMKYIQYNNDNINRTTVSFLNIHLFNQLNNKLVTYEKRVTMKIHNFNITIKTYNDEEYFNFNITIKMLNDEEYLNCFLK